MKVSVSCLVGMSAAVYGLDAPFQTYPDCTEGPLAENKVCDRSLPPAERAAALVDALTNEEKLANLVRYVMPGDKWRGENF
jgi:beta-D-xylosidase 4